MRPAICLVVFVGLVAMPALGWAGGIDDARRAETALFKKRDYRTAIRLFTRAIISGRLPKRDLASAYLNRGVAYQRLKRYGRAIGDYSRVIRFNPRFLCLAYNNRGSVRSKLKQYNRAVADYNRAIRANPKYALAYMNRGITFRRLKKYHLAMADFNRAILLGRRKWVLARAYHSRGRLNQILKKYYRAIGDYDRAIRLAPTQPSTYRRRGEVYKKLGKLRKARADFAKAKQLRRRGR